MSCMPGFGCLCDRASSMSQSKVAESYSTEWKHHQFNQDWEFILDTRCPLSPFPRRH